MWARDNNHTAQLTFHTGRDFLDGAFPTIGAWAHYGLGSLNDNLPQFISMGKREYWNKKDGHYLGPAHDAVPLSVRAGTASIRSPGRRSPVYPFANRTTRLPTSVAAPSRDSGPKINEACPSQPRFEISPTFCC